MKIISRTEYALLIRFDKGEDVIAGVASFATEQQIHGATFSLIGAAQKITLSYYNLSEKKYEDTIIEEDLEITSVIGNIAWLDETAIIHAHGTFGNKNLEVIGGHIKSLIISATGEVFLQQVQTKLIREYNEETGLNLLK